MQHLPQALEPLRAYKQFVLWKPVPSRKRPGKVDKFPCDRNGNVVDAHNPAYWLSADDAIQCAAALPGHGIGFTFTESDPFFFIDIDNAYNNGQWSQVATELCQLFVGAAVEVSQSGTGLHIIGSYSGTEPDHGCKNIPIGLEFYTSERFVALTGTNATGSAIADMTGNLTAVTSKYFQYAESPVSSKWSDGPCATSCPPATDEILIKKAIKSESAGAVFGGKASFADLWTANEEALTASFPDDVRSYDASSADAALAQHLAFWTGNDCARIERLMRMSALVRDKWDYHKSYMFRTITGACGRQTTWYSVGAPIKVAEIIEPSIAQVRDGGYQLMPHTQQMEYFKGCVYVAHNNAIMLPNGTNLTQPKFNAMFGGYSFSMDTDNETTTKKAWEAFTESQCVDFPKADGHCFRPELSPGTIVVEERCKYVNTYIDIQIRTVPGDIGPFLAHLERLLPVERDRQILLSFMSACVQHKGIKFQWAPLIQGVEGNGKTLFTRCVAYAVGQRYTHLPPANEISEKFNEWLFNKLFIGIEDIYVPDHKLEVIEVLKPMITNAKLAMRGMQAAQVMGDNRANFIINSNHKDGIRKTLNDRRYCVMYTAQQDATHLVRDRMTGNYFPDLYDWLNNRGGYAMVAHYLNEYQIADELNPATHCQRAPETSSTSEAIHVGQGAVEQEILEAIDEDRPGFAGGWISSYAMDRLIEGMRRGGSIPRNKRRDLLKSLGYDWHPNLKDGRVNNTIAVENGKPRLFIRDGHIHSNLVGGAEIIRHYSAAQGYTMLTGPSFDANVQSVP